MWTRAAEISRTMKRVTKMKPKKNDEIIYVTIFQWDTNIDQGKEKEKEEDHQENERVEIAPEAVVDSDGLGSVVQPGDSKEFDTKNYGRITGFGIVEKCTTLGGTVIDHPGPDGEFILHVRMMPVEGKRLGVSSVSNKRRLKEDCIPNLMWRNLGTILNRIWNMNAKLYSMDCCSTILYCNTNISLVIFWLIHKISEVCLSIMDFPLRIWQQSFITARITLR